ncbi:uncharacterized protein LOC118558888 [Fundulus heteroclitus]|uniref:uncharacterized protein LOC118558888 n=1 Tax=Fundulus heteroclitus TaxID=8078 RepID=UPI00165CB127|nr:uncharacterized protein LOC118558888 [Fundulus heteroclitus]
MLRPLLRRLVVVCQRLIPSIKHLKTCAWPPARMRMEKMICRILLLIILNLCLCAAAFVVNVTQSSYQAEENHSITLEWTFTTTPNGSWKELFIYCSLLTPRKESVLYQVHDGVEVPESQDEQFSGRVQSDKDVLREGRIRLHVSRLRTEDSGLYLCDVETDDGSGSGSCRLNVSAAADQLQPQRPTLTPEPERWTKIIWITAAAATLVLLCIIVPVFIVMYLSRVYLPLSR